MRGLIEAYCRLASCDPEACAALFAPRAKLILTVAGRPLLLVGRARIREFLEHAPRGLSFRTVACKRIGEDWIAEILVQGGPQPVYEGVRFTVRAGRFAEFEVIAGPG